MALLCESLDEVVKTIRQPVPEKVRQSGFEQAKKSDFFSAPLVIVSTLAPAGSGLRDYRHAGSRRIGPLASIGGSIFALRGLRNLNSFRRILVKF
jgi:hypothetical protein